MRAIRATILVALTGLAVMASAQPASAALAENEDYGTVAFKTCMPDYQTGVQGQYGAWGTFISGCTVQIQCTGSAPCRVSNRSMLVTESWGGGRVTMNARIRYINSAGAVTGWRDKSCEGTNWCRVDDETYIQPGQSASVECNGVRANGANRGRSRCGIILTRSACTGADTPVTQQTATAAARAIVCLANMERSRYGIAALVPHWLLDDAATGHAKAAVANPWWSPTADSHTNPFTGSTSAGRIAAARYCLGPKTLTTAENTYTAGPNPTPRQAVNWWMTHLGPDGTINTNGHRKNILNPALSDLGVGVVNGSADVNRYAQSGTFVQDFGHCINY